MFRIGCNSAHEAAAPQSVVGRETLRHILDVGGEVAGVGEGCLRSVTPKPLASRSALP